LNADLLIMPGAVMQSQLKQVVGLIQNYGSIYFNGTLTATNGYRAIGPNATLYMTLGRDVFNVQTNLLGTTTLIQLTVPPEYVSSSVVRAQAGAALGILLINATNLQTNSTNPQFVINGTEYILQEDPQTGSLYLVPVAVPIAPPAPSPSSPPTAQSGWNNAFWALSSLLHWCHSLFSESCAPHASVAGSGLTESGVADTRHRSTRWRT
jgi:hypothetical protein